MKNKLIDLNNHLFMQLERLTDEDLSNEEMTAEVNRSKAVTNLATQIIGNARLALDAQVAVNDGLLKSAPQMLGVPGYVEED